MAEDYKLIDNEEKHRYEFQIDDKIAKTISNQIMEKSILYIPKSPLPLEEEESVHSLQKRHWRISNDKVYA